MNADLVEMLCTDDAVLDDVPVEVLERQITSFAGRLAAATGTWLVWVGAFDRRLGWQRWEQTSCAGWLNWKCGVSMRAAREHVRVARALEALPEVRSLFLAGELSYSKVRAITRVADGFNEHELCELGLVTTASQMDRVCAGLADRGPLPEWEASVRFEYLGDHGRIVLDVAIDDFHRVKEAVAATADAVIDEAHAGTENGVSRWSTVDGLGGSQAVRTAAMVGLLTGALDTAEGPFEDAMLITDVETLRQVESDPAGEMDASCAGQAFVGESCTSSTRSQSAGECTLAGDWVPPVVARRVACDARLQLAVRDSVDSAVGLGREQRVVNRRMRRLLMRRDGGMCRFPGCGARRRLHAHHVVHWVDGGETELENLIMVCHFHHQSVHEGGWNVVNKNGRFVFYDPAGQASHVEQMADPLPGVPLPELVPIRKAGSAEPVGGWGERMDLKYVVSTLAANAELRRQRLAEAGST